MYIWWFIYNYLCELPYEFHMITGQDDHQMDYWRNMMIMYTLYIINKNCNYADNEMVVVHMFIWDGLYIIVYESFVVISLLSLHKMKIPLIVYYNDIAMIYALHNIRMNCNIIILMMKWSSCICGYIVMYILLHMTIAS